jgi:Fur family ferric uptake transcriptional regulator
VINQTWQSARDRMRAQGLRWTPQRRLVLDVLSGARGHVTAADLVERCRATDPQTTPSTVYRTLDVLEELGLVRHGHGADGREEFHVLPQSEHGHLRCSACGATWEVSRAEADRLLADVAAVHDFSVDLSHLTIVGVCAVCRAAAGPRGESDATG